MRKFLLVILATLTLGLSSAFAQDDMATSGQYAGAILGYPISGVYGLEDVLGEGIDLRFNASLNPFFGLGINVGADALIDISSLELTNANDILIYGGGGVNAGFLSVGNAIASVSAFSLGLSGVIGGEYMFDDAFGLFLETGAGAAFNIGSASTLAGAPTIAGFSPTFRGGLGVKFRF